MTIDVFLSMAESQFAGLLLHELNGAACPVWAEKMKKKKLEKAICNRWQFNFFYNFFFQIQTASGLNVYKEFVVTMDINILRINRFF